MGSSQSEYDQIPYPTNPQAQLHPDRLAILARLFGLEVTPIDRARILEIGCGDGGNLIPIAATLPASEFVGIDLSAAAVARAQRFAKDCALQNITILQADICDPQATQGEFDYILCHGVYSWSPPAVRSAILKLCGERLSPRGLALISYNAFPGWHLRMAARQMLFWHLRDVRASAERIEEGAAFAEFITTHASQTDAGSQALRHEFKSALDKERGIFFHDELAPENQPFYFHEFMAAARSHGLSFVAEPDLFEFLVKALTPEAAALLEQVAGDRLEREQYLDFLVARRFRQSILTRSGRKISDAPQLTALADACFTATDNITVTGEILRADTCAKFQHPNGQTLTTTFLPGKVALHLLLERAPVRIPFNDLIETTLKTLRDQKLPAPEANALREGLPRFLFEAACARFITFHTYQPSFTHDPGPRPLAFAPARVQAAAGARVTNIYHRLLQLDERWTRELLALCDGTRDQQDILRKLTRAVTAAGDQTDPAWNTIRRDPRETIRQLARKGLFIG